MTSKSIYTSPLCSCIICRKEFSQKGIHSHYTTSHTEKGKSRCVRNGKLTGKINFNKANIESDSELMLLKESYFSNPKLCKYCNKVIPFNKRTSNIYCNSVCASTHTNSSKDYTKIKTGSPKFIGPTQPKDRCVFIDKESNCKFTKVIKCTVCGKFTKSPSTPVKTCSTTCRNKIFSATATKNPMMGGNKNNKAYGWYESPYAGKVFLESSYEALVAKSLDESCIRWIRPEYLRYGEKKYYPDFYLVDYDVYLDPKNDYLITIDTPKILQVEEENNVRVLILDKTKLSWNAIKLVLGV